MCLLSNQFSVFNTYHRWMCVWSGGSVLSCQIYQALKAKKSDLCSWGYINKTAFTHELILRVWVWVFEYTHTHAGLCSGWSLGRLFQLAPGCVSSNSNSPTPVPPLASPLHRANLPAVHLHRTLYKLPLQLTCPSQLSIIDEWVPLQAWESATGGRAEPGVRGEQEGCYYSDKLTTTLGVRGQVVCTHQLGLCGWSLKNMNICRISESPSASYAFLFAA